MPTTGPGRLTFPAGLDEPARASALDGVRARVQRFGLDARVTRVGDAISIAPRPRPYVLEALARKEPTTVTTVVDRRPGRCAGAGAESALPSRQCLTVGPVVATAAAVQSARVSRQGLDGFGVDVTVGSAAWPAWRDAFRPQLGQDVAIVSGNEALTETRVSVMALQTRIGGQLREQDARRIAAALLVDAPLPAELSVAHPVTQVGARPGEVWTASLAVKVCGRWLPPAPAFVTDVGVHSHQDGLVYVHTLPPSAIGRRLTLGEFLAKGKWTMRTDHLALWHGVDVRPGDACGARHDTRVTWSMDGVRRHGQPDDATLLPGRRFVVVFGPPGERVGNPPVVGELTRTTWGPQRRT